MVRAIFLDIDGTLRDERTGMPESAGRAVRMCREQNILVLLCTGRNLASIQQDVKSMETDGLIAGGGCMILDGKKVLKNDCFQKSKISWLGSFVSEKGLPFAMESQEKIFMNGPGARLLGEDFEEKLKGLKPDERVRRRGENRIVYKDTLKEYREGKDRIHKFCLWCPLKAFPELMSVISRSGQTALESTVGRGRLKGWRYLELLPPGCGKGAAIRQWCDYKHISLSDTMSFGDGRNDIAMIQTTGIGVAMADGDEELKSMASAVCETASEDGIYRELLRRNIIVEGEWKDEHREEGALVERRGCVSDLSPQL